MTNIELKSEYVLKIFGLAITNSFLTSLIVSLLLVILTLYFFTHQDKKNIFIKTSKVIVYELLKLTDMVTKNRQLSRKILPLIATFFLFIVSANLLALIPGFLGSFFVNTASGPIPLLRSPNSDLTTTLALAIFSVLAIQYFAIYELGIKKYLQKFNNFSTPISFILGFFEILSESIKVLSFSFRLFGNIFAGEILLLVIAFLIPFVIPLPFILLEIFVGIIQAFIFAMLTLTFIKTSIIQHSSSTSQ